MIATPKGPFSYIYRDSNLVCASVNCRDSVAAIVRHIYLCSGDCNSKRPFSYIHRGCNLVCGSVNYRDSVAVIVCHIYLCSIRGNCNPPRSISYIHRGSDGVCSCVNYRDGVAVSCSLHIPLSHQGRLQLLQAGFQHLPWL